jgi:hypothetical protein
MGRVITLGVAVLFCLCRMCTDDSVAVSQGVEYGYRYQGLDFLRRRSDRRQASERWWRH